MPDATVPGDSATPDALMPDAALDDSAVVDANPPVEVARIVRRGTNFGRTTVVVFADANAVRTKEDSSLLAGSFDGLPEPTVDVLPPGSPEVVKFLAELASVDDVSVIGGDEYFCVGQSVSFSTRTFVTVGGKTSRNLECDDSALVTAPALTADCLALAK